MRVSSTIKNAVTTAAVVLLGSSAAAPNSYAGYSRAMATSIMDRSQGIMTGSGDSSELLQAGITQHALTAWAAQYPSDPVAARAREYVCNSAASTIPFVSNETYDALSYPLDRLSNGRTLITESVGSDANAYYFRSGADDLRRSVDLNRRNAEGGLWYFTYPNWSYLDGMYSFGPFYTKYTLATGASALNGSIDAAGVLGDMYHQFELLWSHTRDGATGLLRHGYDESRTAVWADPTTGASPHVWGRSLGWYVVALVETLEILPRDAYPREWNGLREKYHHLAKAIVDAEDPKSHAWWQVLDQPGREGNYIETSGSAMFAYGLLKGARLGLFGSDKKLSADATIAGVAAHDYLVEAALVHETNGTLGYNGTVAVCSLNSDASYEYYIGQPLKYNSVLGSASFVLAALEYERITKKH
ncbi:glycoside hydrolase family 105 protein [Hypoxylon sp. CI-4A]|nr:glycoside hydrolase family 105 protein [Hypoxylon sp. CI-4A]